MARRFDLIAFLSKYGTILSLLALLVIFSLARPEVFPSVRNMLNILNQVSILGIIAIGLTVCLVIAQFDLSIAAIELIFSRIGPTCRPNDNSSGK